MNMKKSQGYGRLPQLIKVVSGMIFDELELSGSTDGRIVLGMASNDLAKYRLSYHAEDAHRALEYLEKQTALKILKESGKEQVPTRIALEVDVEKLKQIKVSAHHDATTVLDLYYDTRYGVFHRSFLDTVVILPANARLERTIAEVIMNTPVNELIDRITIEDTLKDTIEDVMPYLKAADRIREKVEAELDFPSGWLQVDWGTKSLKRTIG